MENKRLKLIETHLTRSTEAAQTLIDMVVKLGSKDWGSGPSTSLAPKTHLR